MASTKTLVTTQDQWDQAMVHLGGKAKLAMDTETNGLVWWKDHVVSVQLGTGDRTFYFPFRHGEGPNLEEGKLKHLATEVLRPERPQVGHNYTFDIKMMAKEGMQTPHQIADSMLDAHIMNENEDTFKMEALGVRYLGADYGDAEERLIDELCERFGCSRKGAKGHMWKLSAERTAEYGMQDTDTTWDLHNFYRPHLETWKLDGIADEVYDFQLALTDMQKRGILIDQHALQELGEEAGPMADGLEARLQDMAREDLGDPDFPANPRSHNQMKFWLGKMLGVADTAKATLKQRGDDPRAKLLLEYRLWQKLKGSFCDPYWNFIAPDGRIHPGIFVTGTSSSRLSMSKPNMQQVPEAAKKLFHAREGYTLVELDYSMAELRLSAHYHATRFGDTNMGDLILAGEDMHQRTADASGIPRKGAKIRNFAIDYGAGATKLAKMFQSTVPAERKYVSTYYNLFPGSRLLGRQMEQEAKRRGYIRYWSGRVRHFNTPTAYPHNAKNNLIQGGVAEMVRRALTRIWREVPEALMVLTVHDSIVFEIPTGILRETVRKLRAIMQDQPWCTIPMVVDASAGPTWGAVEDMPRDCVGIPEEALRHCTDPTLIRG